MDPITAVGFAASILTFIDFSCAVIGGTYEVYKSTTGTTLENAHITTIVDDLERVTDGLISDAEGKPKHTRELCKIAENCHKLSQDLSKILKKLQISDNKSKMKSLKIKIASMRKEKEIVSIEERLDKYRLQILLRLNFMLRWDCTILISARVLALTYNSEQQSSLKVQLDEIQKEGVQMSPETAAQFTCLREELSRAVKALRETKENGSENEENGSKNEENIYTLTDICSALSKLQSMSRSLSWENNILRRLYFDNITARKDNIEDAESGTFKWILEEEQVPEIRNLGNKPKSSPDDQKDEAEQELRRQTRDSFLKWLRSGDQIYHISGRPGAGKSTLMKFLCHHPRVKKELEIWAAEKKLVFAHFFFWNSGEKLQMSLEGLYTALLFETLKQCPELIPEIFPDEWDALSLGTSTLESSSFRMSNIKAAFAKLIGKKTFPKHRLCFFIDGLDEYEGDSVDHWKLASNLQSWASSPDIKICVSSRPHTEFMETFSDSPHSRLRLHELTRHDISHFASAMFEKDRNFERIKDLYVELVEDVVRMANGVFLWARLVVRLLLEGVGHRNSRSALQDKLNSIPKDLDALFDKLLGSVDPSDRKRSDQILFIATGDLSNDPANALAYSWLEELENPKFPFSSAVRGYSDEEITKRHHNLRPQLDGLTKGLLEMIPNGHASDDIFFGYTVQFFHRTVRDYLQDDSRQSQFQGRLPDFDRNEVYSRLCLAELKFARTRPSYFGDRHNALWEIFHHSHLWHRRTCKEGHRDLFKFFREVSSVLNSYRHLPFSYPEESIENSGSITWGQQETIDWFFHFQIFKRNFSYPHYVARLGQHQYISQILSENPTLLKGDGEISILLSASWGENSELTRFLLQSGANPQDQVEIQDGPSARAKTATVWIIVLATIVNSLLKNDNLAESGISVLEEYLKTGVNTDIFFLIKPSSWATKVYGDGVYSISLEKLIRLRRPKSFEALQIFFVDKGEQSIWRNARSLITKFPHWNKPSFHIGSENKPFEFEELGKNEFHLISICAKDCQLGSSFRVSIY